MAQTGARLVELEAAKRKLQSTVAASTKMISGIEASRNRYKAKVDALRAKRKRAALRADDAEATQSLLNGTPATVGVCLL